MIPFRNSVEACRWCRQVAVGCCSVICRPLFPYTTRENSTIYRYEYEYSTAVDGYMRFGGVHV